MNGTSPPDRAQPLDLSKLQGQTRAQTLCPVFSCKDPEEKQTACGSRGHGGTRSRALTHPLTISSCENKAPRAMGGDIHGDWPVSHSLASWI